MIKSSLNSSLAHESSCIVLGGGLSGLTIGYLTRAPIFEKNSYPGGILASYCFDPRTGKKEHCKSRRDNCALFEVGGGHWLWGLRENECAYGLLSKFTSFRKYTRKSSVYLTDFDMFVPYPIQYNLRYLPKDIREKALEDLICSRKESLENISDKQELSFDKFLNISFGKTLYEIFFKPYNYMYTDALMHKVAPPRGIKIPNDLDLILRGLKENATTSGMGYNSQFLYPNAGLGSLMWRLHRSTRCHLNHEVTNIDLRDKVITVNDKLQLKYKKLYVAIPLKRALELCGTRLSKKADPYVSVLVINIIAKKGRKPSSDHWRYISKTKTNFHRIGYYSNVDEMFLPKQFRNEKYAAAYIERVFREGATPKNIPQEAERIINEAVELELIGSPLVHDTNFIEIAYTWKRVGSYWVDTAIQFLLDNSVKPIGRYANWGKIEGMVESIEDAYSACTNWNEKGGKESL